jgi:acetaldehyde dehydrogenase (acetylating)
VDEPPSDETAEPVAPQPPTDDPLLRTLREDAWLRVGIESSHETALAAYARQTGLGMPVTHEFVSGDFTAQGFAGGIVFARTDDPAAITHIAW